MPLNAPGFNLAGILQSVQGQVDMFQRKKQEDAAAKQDQQMKVQADPVNGLVNIQGVREEQLSEIMKLAKVGQETLSNYDRMEQQNRAQQEQLRSHPFANTLAQLAASFAKNDPNPYTRAVGDAASKLNPTMADLQKQQMGIMEGKLGAVQGQMGVASRLMEMERLRQADTREARLADTAKAEQISKTFKEMSAAAQKGELSDPKITAKVLQDAGHSPERAEALATLLVGASKEKQRLVAEAQAATDKRAQDALKERQRESDSRMALLLKAANTKSADKEDEKKALEMTAQSFAAGDLNAVRDVASMRGPDRMKLFARIKELDPNFTMADMNRKIDMEKSFTVGKDGQAIQSFGTFLQHAGEVTETIKGIQQSGSPALNKPLNWWRKNMAGTPEYQRLLASLEPVGKEFESFLLNNRALYKDDRDRIEALLNGNSSPAQIMATLNQMGKTAKDRFASMNQRYKRVMKRDIELPFGPEEMTGAAKIGIELPGGREAPAPTPQMPPGWTVKVK